MVLKVLEWFAVTVELLWQHTKFEDRCLLGCDAITVTNILEGSAEVGRKCGCREKGSETRSLSEPVEVWSLLKGLFVTIRTTGGNNGSH
jgi:hypothetical protein